MPPATLATSMPWYDQVDTSYVPVAASKPLNTPPRSSVSRKSSPTMLAALVYSTT